MKNAYVLDYTHQLESLFTIIRNKETKREDFIFYFNRIIRLLIEKSLNLLPSQKKEIITSTDSRFLGYEFKGKICTVSIVRAGEAMEKVIRGVCKKIRIGKILIQRDEATAKPIFYYSKLHLDVSERNVLLQGNRNFEKMS